MENSVYEAPESALVDETNAGDEIKQMTRFSAWGVLGLSLITLGIYSIYWLYSRGESINRFHKRKISQALLLVFVVASVFYYIGEIAVGMKPDVESLTIAFLIVALVYVVSYLVLLFQIRSRLMSITGDSINPVLTFFFSVLYLQYRINKAIDNKSP